jgi:hypothetical protein
MPQSRDSLALTQLVTVARQIGEHTRMEKFAMYAYIQAHVAQAQCQVVFDLLREKGMLTDSDLERRITERINDCTQRLRDTQLIHSGLPTSLVRP